MKSVIVIPARYGSTRFPGKPLQMIAGKTMLQRVYEIGLHAAQGKKNVQVFITTDDERICDHAHKLGAQCVVTPVECPTGTDRAFAALQQLPEKADFILNFQGDAPLTPPWILTALLDAAEEDDSVQAVTPAVRLSWEQLDRLREHKKTTPMSGTTVTINSNGDALWFSKNIIPAIRGEEKQRTQEPLSPVYRHIGLYGYRYQMLQKYIEWQPSYYETLEGLEQLRILEHGFPIRMVVVDYRGRPSMSGVDTPEDVKRAEALLAQYGEIV